MEDKNSKGRKKKGKRGIETGIKLIDKMERRKRRQRGVEKDVSGREKTGNKRE